MRASGDSISLTKTAPAVTATFSGRPFVTPTKHSPKLSLIEKQLSRKIACRAGCLPTIKPAPSEQPQCRTSTQSTNSHPPTPQFLIDNGRD